MKRFDHYEFTGIFVPGAAVLFGAGLLFPRFLGINSLQDISFGGFGIFVVLAYVAGHLVQAIGNALESVWWKIWGGIPSDWARTEPDCLLAPGQAQLLQDSAQRRLGLQPFKITELTARQWYAVTRQIYAEVAGANRASRIEIFNGNYGLNRGLAAGLLLVAIAALATNPPRYDAALIAAVAAGIAAYRMHRFARHYARELFVQFLQLPATAGARETSRDLTE